jgi:hypothetical protein
LNPVFQHAVDLSGFQPGTLMIDYISLSGWHDLYDIIATKVEDVNEFNIAQRDGRNVVKPMKHHVRNL